MAKKTRTVFGMMLLLTAVFAGWALPDAAPAATILKVGGTGSALGSMQQLAQAFEQEQAGIRIKILPSLGSTAGVKAALNGGLDLALASRPLTESERRKGAVATEYAKSPLVFVTHGMVDRKDVTLRELEAIYGGQTLEWSDGSRIRLILRPAGDIDTKLISGLSPAMAQAMKALLARPGMIVAITDQESTAAVAKTPGALGCATLTEILSQNARLNVLTLNGVQPSAKTLADRTYPMIKTLSLVTTPHTPAAARQFAEFVRSPAGRDILVRTENLVPEAE